MPEEAVKEIAAGSEQPPVEAPNLHRLASQEFFFLLQRVDRLDEKLTGRIDHVESKLTERIDHVESRLTERVNQVESKLSDRIDHIEEEFTGRLDNIRFWAIGAVVAIVVGFGGTIATLIYR